jgi:hypothetical protein
MTPSYLYTLFLEDLLSSSQLLTRLSLPFLEISRPESFVYFSHLCMRAACHANLTFLDLIMFTVLDDE